MHMTTQTGGKVARMSATKKFPSMARVMRYQNEAVIVKLMDKLKLDRKEAELLFSDMLKYIWLAAKFGKLNPTTQIDEAWHAFIMFTMDYQKFCHKYFGRFIHHRPHYPTDPPDDGLVQARTVALVTEHLGKVGEELSANWSYPLHAGCREYCKCPCT